MRSLLRFLILLLVVGLLTMVFLGCSDSDGGSIGSTSANLTNRLYVAAAESGTLTPTEKASEFIITLNQVWTDVKWFTDRPVREKGENTTTDYVGYLWPLIYGDVAPNAVIKFHVAGANAGLFASLAAPEYNPDAATLIFRATLLNYTFDENPQSFLEFDTPVVTVLNNVPSQDVASSFVVYGENAFIDLTSTEGLYTLTQDALDNSVLLANNAPGRYSSVSTTEEFVSQWSGRFSDDPPNAVISGLTDTGELYGYILTLADPIYDEAANSITYSATVLGQETEIPGTLSSATLVVDDVTPTPGSFAEKVPTAYQSSNSPFSASVGMGQETDNQAQGQLDTIAANFKMIHIYRYNKAALDIATANGMEVFMGTDIGIAKGFAESPSNAVDYVRTNVDPYKSVIKTIGIGNEPNIVQTYIDAQTFASSVTNLSNALKAEGLNIAVSTNLVYGCTISPYPPNSVTFQPSGTESDGIYSPIPYIKAIAAANSKPFIFFDFYPNLAYGPQGVSLQYCLTETGGGPGGQCCGMFDAQYLSACNATYAVDNSIEIYVGETGWPNADGAGPQGSSYNQAAFINNFYKNWVSPQGKTIPVFLFYAYPNRDINSMFALFNNGSIDFSNYSKFNK